MGSLPPHFPRGWAALRGILRSRINRSTLPGHTGRPWSLLWNEVRTAPPLSASWACLFSPHGHTPTEHLGVSLQGKSKMAADRSISADGWPRSGSHVWRYQWTSKRRWWTGGSTSRSSDQRENSQARTQPPRVIKTQVPKDPNAHHVHLPEFGTPDHRGTWEGGGKQELRQGWRWSRRCKKCRNRMELEGRKHISEYRLSLTSTPKPSQVWLYQSKYALQVTSPPPVHFLRQLGFPTGQEAPSEAKTFPSLTCSVPRVPTKNLLLANC